MRGRVRPEVTSFFTLIAPPGGASWLARGEASPGSRRGAGLAWVLAVLSPCTTAAVPQAAAGVAPMLCGLSESPPEDTAWVIRVGTGIVAESSVFIAEVPDERCCCSRQGERRKEEKQECEKPVRADRRGKVCFGKGYSRSSRRRIRLSSSLVLVRFVSSNPPRCILV